MFYFNLIGAAILLTASGLMLWKAIFGSYKGLMVGVGIILYLIGLGMISICVLLVHHAL